MVRQRTVLTLLSYLKSPPDVMWDIQVTLNRGVMVLYRGIQAAMTEPGWTERTAVAPAEAPSRLRPVWMQGRSCRQAPPEAQFGLELSPAWLALRIYHVWCMLVGLCIAVLVVMEAFLGLYVSLFSSPWVSGSKGESMQIGAACLLSTMLLTWGSALCHAGVQLVFDAARGEVASLPISELSDVKSLKQRLQQHGLPPRFRQRLLHEGNNLDDAVMLDSLMDLQVLAPTSSHASQNEPRRGGALKRRLEADSVPDADAVTDLQVVTLPFSERFSQDQDQPLELWTAATQGIQAQVESLLQLPLDPDFLYYSSTPLMRASENGHVAVVRLLLEASAQTDLHRHRGETALMDAAGGGHSQVVQLLLEAGAQKDLRDLENSTALMYAAFNGRDAVVRLLLEAGAQKDLCDEDGRTALMDAASEGHVAVVQVLLEAGAQKDVQDNVGGTALMTSAFNGQSPVVQLLLEASVDKDVSDDYGKTALIYATERQFNDVQRLLEATANASRAGA
eukprot:s742_g11.t1